MMAQTHPTSAGRQSSWLSAGHELVFRLIVLVVVPVIFIGLPTVLRAELINVKSAVIRLSDDGYVVDAEFDFALTSPLEAALVRGTPLYFILESDVTRSRAFWFDERISTTPSVRRITYAPLTRSYRVDGGGAVSGGATFSSLDEAIRQIRIVRNRPFVDRGAIQSGQRYEVSLRLRLDSSQLPKPLQVNTLVSREWTLVSDWYRVVLTP